MYKLISSFKKIIQTSCSRTFTRKRTPLLFDLLAGKVLVNYVSIIDALGYQFEVFEDQNPVVVSQVDEGPLPDAINFAFSVSGNNNIVLGFSLSAATIPPGSGLLVRCVN